MGNNTSFELQEVPPTSPNNTREDTPRATLKSSGEEELLQDAKNLELPEIPSPRGSTLSDSSDITPRSKEKKKLIRSFHHAILPGTNKTPRTLNKLLSFVELPQIPPSQLTFFETIGWGSTGVIKRGMWKGVVVAIKQLFTNSDRAKFRQEVLQWHSVRHSNIIEVKGACSDPNNLLIVMEYMNNGSLTDYLRNVDLQFSVAWPTLFKVIVDIVQAMIFLHSSNRIHRDLKPANILLNKENDVITAKLCDFGECRTHSLIMTPRVGTAAYMAPELLAGEVYTNKVDVYSFGILLWEIISREEPFSDIHFIHEIIEKVFAGERPKIPSDCPPKISSLISDCWHQNPDIRPSFPEILVKLEEISKMWEKYAVGDITNMPDESSRSSFRKQISVHSLPETYRSVTKSSKHPNKSPALHTGDQATDTEITFVDDTTTIDGDDDDDDGDDDSYDELLDPDSEFETDSINLEDNMVRVDINLDDNNEEEEKTPSISVQPHKPNVAEGHIDVHNQRYKLLANRKKNLHSLLFSEADIAAIRRSQNKPPIDSHQSPPLSGGGSGSSGSGSGGQPSSVSSSSSSGQPKPPPGRPFLRKETSPEDADKLLIQVLKIALRRESDKVNQLKNLNDYLRNKVKQQQQKITSLQDQLAEHQHQQQHQQHIPVKQLPSRPPIPTAPETTRRSSLENIISSISDRKERKIRKIASGLRERDNHRERRSSGHNEADQLKSFLVATHRKLSAQACIHNDNVEDRNDLEITFSKLELESSPFFYSSYCIWYNAQYFNISVKLPIVICGINTEKLKQFRERVSKIQRITHHPNLVQIIGMVTVAPNYCVVYQNDDNYSLLPSTITSKHIPLTEKMSILHTIASTIEFCHQRGIVIGQFNSRSILLHNKIGSNISNSSDSHPPNNNNMFSPLLSSSYPSLSSLKDSFDDSSILKHSGDDGDNNNTNTNSNSNNNNNNNGNSNIPTPRPSPPHSSSASASSDEFELNDISSSSNNNNNEDKKLRRTISKSPKPMKVKLLHECDIINFGKQKDLSWSKYRWLSPELIRANSPEIAYTFKSDVYTFGLLIWYLLAEQEPFHSLDDQEVAMKLESANYKIDIPKSWPVEISELLNSCWKLKPESRPTMNTIAENLRTFKDKLTGENFNNNNNNCSK